MKVILYTTKTCAICKQIKPKFLEMSAKYRNIPFYIVDAGDNNPYNISHVPTIIVDDNGQIGQYYTLDDLRDVLI